MKVLYVNAMGPREKTPQGGIFVTQRIKALRGLGVNVIPLAIYMDHSFLARNLLRLKGVYYAGKPIDNQEAIQYYVSCVSYNLLEMLITKFYPRYYEFKICKQLKFLNVELEGIDLIHLHWLWPVGLAVTKISQLYNIPYAITCHGSEINIGMSNPNICPYYINILENAAFVEFVSQALLDKAIEFGYSGHNARVIYNGIDTNIFKLREKEDNNRKKRVGFVGNLIPVKGADRIPEIFYQIYEKMGDEVEFVVVGQGNLLEQLKTQMQGLAVRFTGQLIPQDLSQEYNNFDVLIVPSRSEGFPCVIKEAQTCGVIVIGNAVGGVSEAIGKYGIIVKEDREENLIKQMANAVVSVLEHGEMYNIHEMVQEAAGYSWINQQKKSLHLYEQALATRYEEYEKK